MWPHSTYVPNYDTTTAHPDYPRAEARLRNQCGRWGSSWAVTHPHVRIGITGFRARELLRNRQALYRRIGKEWMSLCGFLPLSYNHDVVAVTTSGSVNGERWNTAYIIVS
jgi:hypothetical protein